MSSVSRKTLTLIGLFAALLAAPASARELRVCADPNNMPFSNEAGEGIENRVAAIVAEELGATIATTWWAQRRGFLRNTLKAGVCDVVPGLPVNLEGVRTTAPYYRSSYVFATRPGGPVVTSFDDPALRTLRVGVQLVGDDGWNTPPAHALSRRGITANVRGYMIYGDYARPNPADDILNGLVAGEVDVAIVWGPLAGWFSRRQAEPLTLTPVAPAIDGPQMPMVWDISMAVRKEDVALRHEITAALKKRQADIRAVLAEFGVPVLEKNLKQAELTP